MFGKALARELYRALAHLSVVAVYHVNGDQLVTIASCGPIEHTLLSVDVGIPGAALAQDALVVVPMRERDLRALVTIRPFAAELAVPLVRTEQPTLILNALIDEPTALGYDDRELWRWLRGRQKAVS